MPLFSAGLSVFFQYSVLFYSIFFVRFYICV